MSVAEKGEAVMERGLVTRLNAAGRFDLLLKQRPLLDSSKAVPMQSSLQRVAVVFSMAMRPLDSIL